jgi:predicted XRE-type DNA-binding protein
MTNKERNQEIAVKYNQGDTVGDLAAEFGLSSGTVRNIVLVLGASRSEAIKSRQEQFMAMVASKNSQAEAAKALGVSQSRVSYLIKKTKQEKNNQDKRLVDNLHLITQGGWETSAERTR